MSYSEDSWTSRIEELVAWKKHESCREDEFSLYDTNRTHKEFEEIYKSYENERQSESDWERVKECIPLDDMSSKEIIAYLIIAKAVELFTAP